MKIVAEVDNWKESAFTMISIRRNDLVIIQYISAHSKVGIRYWVVNLIFLWK